MIGLIGMAQVLATLANGVEGLRRGMGLFFHDDRQQANNSQMERWSLPQASTWTVPPLAIANRYYDANSEPVQNTRYRLILTKTSTLNWVTRWACNAEPQRTRQSWNMSLGAKNSGATMGVKSIRPTWFEDETVAKTAAEPMHALRLIIKEDVLPLRNHPEALDRRCITASAAREIKGRNSRAVIGVKSTRPTLFEDETAAKQPLNPCMVYVSSSKRIFLWPAPLSFDWSPHLRLTCGPAGNRTTTGSLSASSRTTLYQLLHRDASHHQRGCSTPRESPQVRP